MEADMEKYIIGIDSGTTSIKAVLFDLLGNEIDKKAFPLTGIFPKENYYEEDMLEIWEKASLCIKEISIKHSKDDIVGIGITAQGDGLWLVDKDIKPVYNGICFCDGRAADIVERWVENGVCDELFKLTGTRVFTGNQNCIVKWMDENVPDILAKARYFLHLKDFLFYMMTGELTTDATDQSLVFVDQNTRQYLDKAFEICGLIKYRDKYPPLKSAKENASRILPNLAAEWGLSKDIIITSGPMDVSACALGSGVVENGCCCSIIGTAALHEMVLDKPLQDDIRAGMTITHVMEKRWLRLMASLAGTPNLNWFLDTFGKQIVEEAATAGVNVFSYMETIIKDIPVGANGVLYHPYLLAGGERAPFTDARARAAFNGLSVKHTLWDLIRAVYEGVAYSMLDCYRHMPLEIKNVTVCGGGAASAFWCQMFADALRTRIVTIKGEELGAKGVIINNAVVQGFYSDYTEAVSAMIEINKTYEPDMGKHAEYLKFYELYKKTYQLVAETWKIRAAILNL
jgi:sugar (pentulose or hexulose) kinase